jgi:hypothetical protein
MCVLLILTPNKALLSLIDSTVLIGEVAPECGIRSKNLFDKVCNLRIRYISSSIVYLMCEINKGFLWDPDPAPVCGNHFSVL